jgi:hypothetical protein
MCCVRVKILNVTLFGLLSCSFLCTNARAQKITFDGCRDINDVRVASASNSSIQDIAMAAISNGNPVIFYNPNILATTRSQTRLFFYAHECAHHALGHVLSGLRPGQEQEADCWGVNKLTQLRLLDDQDITMIQLDLARFARGDWTHLPGPQRAINLRACLNDSSSPVSADLPSPRPRGHWEVTQCIHALHPAGDAGPCQHICGWNNYGQPLPCHSADLYPCVHPAHPNGDRVWVTD